MGPSTKYCQSWLLTLLNLLARTVSIASIGSSNTRRCSYKSGAVVAAGTGNAEQVGNIWKVKRMERVEEWMTLDFVVIYIHLLVYCLWSHSSVICLSSS